MIASVFFCEWIDAGIRMRKVLKLLSTCTSGSTADSVVALEQLRRVMLPCLGEEQQQ